MIVKVYVRTRHIPQTWLLIVKYYSFYLVRICLEKYGRRERPRPEDFCTAFVEENGNIYASARFCLLYIYTRYEQNTRQIRKGGAYL